jgi:2-oxoglutarate dehydrogenase complex dehydrogenase (E1) component-like enzyme
LERWLQASANDNIQVVNPTNAAQFFHLIRRQVLRTVRKPLIVMAPKSGLRLREYQSPVSALTSGTFSEVLDDPGVEDPSAVRRVLLCSGKIAYKLLARRGPSEAVLRVEQLYPWPADQIADVLARYEHAGDVTWVQEEPENMGAWEFVHRRLHALLRDDYRLTHVARAEAGAPAAGSSAFSELEENDMLDRVFGAAG